MSDSINDPDWPEILRAVQAQLQDQLHTSCPGIVKAYDVATQTAKVQLAVQMKGTDGEMTTVPVLEDVPVVWPGGAQGHLHIPLAAGDTVMVVFGESDFGGWWETGSVSAPKSLARHDLNAVAIPGCRRAAAPLSVTGGHVTLAATSMLHLGTDTATAFVALANLVDARLATIQAAFDAHVHITTATVGATPTPGVIASPAPPIGPLATVAATKVKAS